jgi:hypothetical protein
MLLLSVSLSIFASFTVCWVYSLLWRRRVRKNLETDILIGKLKAEIGQMVTELNGSAERNIELLENRIRTASELVEKAVKTAGVLEKEKEKQESVDRVYTALARSRPLSIDVEVHSVQAENMELPDTADFDSLPVREKALVLYRRGENIDSIGEKLSMSRGEVDLIISLHDRRR